MSDLEEERPLTRRERRLREMVETGEVSTIDGAEQQLVEPQPAESGPEARETFDDIVIAPVDEQGNPRTRREMRLLREQAIAARSEVAAPVAAPVAAVPEEAEPAPAESVEAQSETAAAPAEASLPDAQPEPVADSGQAATLETAPEAETTPELATPEAAAPEAVTPEAEPAPAWQPTPAADAGATDDDGLEETQPFSIDDLRDIESVIGSDREDQGDVIEPSEAAKAGDFDPRAMGAQLAAGFGSPRQDPEPPEAVPAHEEPVPPAADAPQEPDVRPDDPEQPVESVPEPTPAKAGYSFPDIAPLDEQISVFDDPSQRTAPGPAAAADAGASGDFDELISRAVAQESATSTTNTSALILPALPDTGDLSGPLGNTCELFITGSISLPKSLGETGGHVPMADAGEVDGLEDLGFDAVPATSNPILPVSAARAVSAVGASGPVVEQETKEKSKLPLVLIITGGALVVAVVALLSWGWSSGMFG